jgi:asparagine synthase (glutamine-hydrolysing)
MSKIIRHGPDWSGIYSNDKALCLMRLAIVDPASGKQPLLSEDGFSANGEIYNHRELQAF